MSEQQTLTAGMVLAVVAALAGFWNWRSRRASVPKRVVGVIPARYESSRFPGKPLVPIRNVPMIVRTYNQACKANQLDFVVVATDDDRIAAVCRNSGAPVIMTSTSCPNGTVRCDEAVRKLEEGGNRFDIVINIQGDEPLIEPEVIDSIVRALRESPEAVHSTAATPLPVDQVGMPQRVKVVLDKDGHAMYYSRGILPADKAGGASRFPAPFSEQPYLLHLGIQCYRRAFLADYCLMPATPYMMMEDLEQLKILENGYKSKVIVVEHCSHGVDTPADIESVENMMQRRGID